MNQLLLIVLIMLAPIIVTVVWMNSIQKRQRRQKGQQHIRYLNQVIEETGINITFQKQLVYQTVILDENARKLLVIYLKGNGWYNLINIGKIKGLNIIKEPPGLPWGNQKYAELFPTKVAIEIESSEDDGSEQIVFYDHIEQNVHVLPEMEREATRLLDRIVQVKNRLVAVH